MTHGKEQTVLFSDIRDFTSLTAQRGDQEAYKLVKTFKVLIETQIEKQSGVVIKSYGDGLMATLPAPNKGSKAAINIQRELSEHNEANPGDTISAGIGLNWGATIQEEGDIFGHAVNYPAPRYGACKDNPVMLPIFSLTTRDPAVNSPCSIELGTNTTQVPN